MNKEPKTEVKCSPLPRFDFEKTPYSSRIKMDDFGGGKDITLQLHWSGGIKPDALDGFNKMVCKAVNTHQTLIAALEEAVTDFSNIGMYHNLAESAGDYAAKIHKVLSAANGE